MDTLERAETIAKLLTNVPGITGLVPFANPIPTIRIECADEKTAKRLRKELDLAFDDLNVPKDPQESHVFYLR